MSEKKTPFDLLHGKKVVIQSNQGVIYEGTFGGLFEDYFILTDGRIIGRKHIAYADFILLKKGPVTHIHLYPKKIEPKPLDISKIMQSKGKSKAKK